MEPRVVVAGSRWKVVMVPGICAMFVAGGWFMVSQGEWFGWVVAGFFGPGGLVVLAMLLWRGWPSIVLDDKGFELTAVFRRSRIAWADVDAFFVTSISGAKMLGMDFVPGYEPLKRARRLAQFLTGSEGAIPDQYALSPEDLCRLLEEWRRRHTPVARTARLVLRRLTEADGAFYCRLANDPDWLRNIGDRNVPTPAAAAKFIRTKTLPGYEALGFGMYLVARKDDGKPLGLAGLVQRDTLPGPDLGFAFLPEARGQGYALEAARAVVEHARTLGIERLLAIVSPHNTASSRLLEKLGFKQQGTTQAAPADPLLLYVRNT